MYKNYIFDFGQVIIHFSPYYMTSAFVEDEADKQLLTEIVFDRLYWDKLDDGSITDEELKSAVCERLPHNLHEVACKIYDHWFENLPLIDGMSDLLIDLKAQGAKLYLLSNVSKGFAYGWQKVPHIAKIFSLFDGLVFSGPLEIIKPDIKIFEHLLNTYSLSSEDCIFIDDSEKNISGAKKAGIQGYLFDGDAQKLRKELIK